MALASNNPYNSRLLEDANYVKSASLQTAVVTAGLDFVQASPYPTTEQVILQADMSALTSTLAGGITASVSWQDSADNSSFAAISKLAAYTSKGTASIAAISGKQVLLPPDVKRYVRLAAAFTDPAGAATTNYTGSITASVLF